MTSGRNGAVLLAVAVIIIATLVGRAFTVLQPGQHDAQLFRLIGTLWLDGWIPYRDIWDNKPPGIYALAALIAAAPLPWYSALVLVEAAAVMLACAAVYQTLRELAPEPTTATLGALCCAFALNLDVLNEGGFTTELFAAAFAATSMLLFLRARQRFVPTVLAGACAGTAALFKQPGMAVLLAMCAYLLATRLLRKSRHNAIAGIDRPVRWPGSILLLGLGAALPWFVIVVYFAAQHAAADMLHAIFTFNLHNAAALQPPLAEAVPRLARALFPIAPLVLGAAALPFLARPKRDEPALDTKTGYAWLILLWIALELAGAMAGGRYYGHYLLTLVPPLSIATALALAALPDQRRVRRVATIIVPALLAAQLTADAARLPAAQPTDYARTITRAINRAGGISTGATLLTWDYLPAIYVRTGLRPAARYSYVPYHGATQARAAIADTVLAALRRQPPDFLVDAGPLRPLPGRDSLRFAEYAAFVTTRYHLVFSDSTHGLRVFQRLVGPAGR